MDSRIQRLAALPQHEGEVWHGGIIKMPAWVNDPPGKPWRPRMALWASPKAHKVHMSEPAPATEVTPDRALGTLLEFALDKKLTGYRPEAVEVVGGDIARHLIDRLEGTGIRIVARDEIPALKALTADLAQSINPTEPPGPLSGDGVTVERMRAFAEAAADFYHAAPWDHLLDDDLIHVESPANPKAVPKDLSYASVLGAGGSTFGLGFFDSQKAHDALRRSDAPDRTMFKRPAWTLQFDSIDSIPFADADLFEDEDLPVAGPKAYPHSFRYDPKGTVTRPDARTLAYLEGLMRALAATTEAEIDSGRWQKTVQTADGPLELTLSIPHLLEAAKGKPSGQPEAREPYLGRIAMERMMAQMQRAMQEQGFKSAEEANAWLGANMNNLNAGELAEAEPATPLERAQDLVYEAWEARGRRQVQLARKALEISPDCADAWVLLAQRHGDPAKALPFWEKAVAAGERALGPEVFAEEAGHFWGILETRPYMRAREGLAWALEDLGRNAEAADHYREMLRLNPGDNQGNRYALAPLLLKLDRDEEAKALLSNPEYEDDDTAIFTYLRALLEFRRHGPGPKARQLLQHAMRGNPFVVGHLLGMMEPPPFAPSSYSPGDPREAAVFGPGLKDVFEQTPGAMKWLESCPPPTGIARGKRAGGRAKSKGAKGAKGTRRRGRGKGSQG